MGDKRVWRRTGERSQLPAMIAHESYGGEKCYGLWSDHHHLEDGTPHLPGGISLVSTTETMSLSLLLYLTSVGMGMRSSFKTTMQEPIVDVFSKTTSSSAESILSHGQRSPQTCLQLNICGTSSGDVSGDILTSYRTSTSSLRPSCRNGAGSPIQLWSLAKKLCSYG